MGRQIKSMIDTLLDASTGVLKPPRFAATCHLQKLGGTATSQYPLVTYYAVAAPADSSLSSASLCSETMWTFSGDGFLARNEINKWLWDRRARQIQKYPQDLGEMMAKLIPRHPDYTKTAIEKKLGCTQADSGLYGRVENANPSMMPNEYTNPSMRPTLKNSKNSAGFATDSVAAGDQTCNVNHVVNQFSRVTLASAPSITSLRRRQETAGISARNSKTVASGMASVCIAPPPVSAFALRLSKKDFAQFSLSSTLICPISHFVQIC